jgi:hypothetical protein
LSIGWSCRAVTVLVFMKLAVSTDRVLPAARSRDDHLAHYAVLGPCSRYCGVCRRCSVSDAFLHRVSQETSVMAVLSLANICQGVEQTSCL